jgi:hypothetical protein
MFQNSPKVCLATDTREWEETTTWTMIQRSFLVQMKKEIQILIQMAMVGLVGYDKEKTSIGFDARFYLLIFIVF